MKAILNILVFILITSNVFSQDIVIKIVVYKQIKGNIAWTDGIDEITLRHNGVIIKKFLTNINGIVNIPRFLLSDKEYCDVSITIIGIQENYLTTIDESIKDTVYIKLPKDYNIRFGYAICPKCNRSNKVCKISTEPILVRTFAKGDTILSPIHKRTYHLGTDVWHEFNPLWYCKRDSIMF